LKLTALLVERIGRHPACEKPNQQRKHVLVSVGGFYSQNKKHCKETGAELDMLMSNWGDLNVHYQPTCRKGLMTGSPSFCTERRNQYEQKKKFRCLMHKVLNQN
jgi:hypothetical protein